VRLAWHIAQKDLRRLAWPLGAWLPLVLSPPIVLACVVPSIQGHAASSLDAWRSAFSIWLQLLLAVQLFLGYLLVGSSVLEDPLVGTTAFWSTRPIARGRLLAAKLLAAAIVLVVAPIVMLMPLWFANGFNLGDAALAGWDFVQRFGGGVVLALLAGSLARTLAQFLAFSLVLAAAFFATTWVAFHFSRPTSWGVAASREWLMMAATLPLLALALLHQFLTRRTMRTWFLLGATIVVLFVMRLAWPFEINVTDGRPRPTEPMPEDRAGEIMPAPAFTQHQASSAPSLYGRSAWSVERFSVPMFARSSDGRIELRASTLWMSEASVRMVGNKAATTPLRWQLSALGFFPANRGEPEFTGTLEAWSVRPRVIGEMPMRVGAELQVGPDRTRILDLLFHEERLDNIYVEEHGPDVQMRAAWSDNWSRRSSGNVRYVDCYVLVNREKKIATAAHLHDLGSLEAGGLAVRLRELGVAWREAERGVPTLVKVRFERDHGFTLPLHVRGVSTRGFDQIP